MVETRRKDVPEGKFTLIFLAADQDLKQAKAERAPEVELTYNWDSEETYTGGRNFGHLAFTVKDIYATCAKLMAEESLLTGLHVMGAWPLLNLLTVSRLNCCRKARHRPQQNLGHPWKILAAGTVFYQVSPRQ